MTKLFVQVLDEDSTEADAVLAVVESECFAGITLDELIKTMEDDGANPSNGLIFVFEVVDKGKIKTSHSFVSSKKTKSS